MNGSITATGYAAKNKDGELLVASISPTALAAKVNWITVVGGFMVHQHNTDAQINQAFDRLGTPAGWTIVPVDITERV